MVLTTISGDDRKIMIVTIKATFELIFTFVTEQCNSLVLLLHTLSLYIEIAQYLYQLAYAFSQKDGRSPVPPTFITTYSNTEAFSGRGEIHLQRGNNEGGKCVK